MDVAAHDLTRTIDCQIVGCDQAAEPGALVCYRHAATHAAPRPSGSPEPASAGASGRRPRGYWTRERTVQAVQEVAGKIGGTPNRRDMADAGYGGAVTAKALARFGLGFADLVRTAGLEPRSGRERLPTMQQAVRGPLRVAPVAPRPDSFAAKARALVPVGRRLDAAIARKDGEMGKIRQQRAVLQTRETTLDQDIAAALREWRTLLQQLAG